MHSHIIAPYIVFYVSVRLNYGQGDCEASDFVALQSSQTNARSILQLWSEKKKVGALSKIKKIKKTELNDL